MKGHLMPNLSELDAAQSLDGLIERGSKATGPDNRLDCEIDIALFEPDRQHVSVRMNAAGTKLIYTRHDGKTDTFWSQDHTLNDMRRRTAIEALRALQHSKTGDAA